MGDAPERIFANPYYGMTSGNSGIWRLDNPNGRGTEYRRADLCLARANQTAKKAQPICPICGDSSGMDPDDDLALGCANAHWHRPPGGIDTGDLSPTPAGVKVKPLEWKPMDTAPKGEITDEAGIRGNSEWFLGRVSPEFRNFRPPFIVIQRCAWPHEDSWQCAGEAHYVPRFFDAWTELDALEPTPADPLGDERVRGLVDAAEYLVGLGGNDCLDPLRAALAAIKGEGPC